MADGYDTPVPAFVHRARDTAAVLVRRATVADAAAIAAIHVATWRVAYRGHVPQEHLDDLDAARSERGWATGLRDAQPPGATAVLVDDGTVIGFVNFSACRDDDCDPTEVGEVNAIYLSPRHWGTGGGRLLMAAALRELARAGFREAILWVLATNARARRFYEAGGWRPDGAVKTDDSRGFPLVEARYRRPLS
jgi:GNAT superfamily N-acetyltransferase